VQPHLALGKSGRNVEEDVDVGAAHYNFVDAAYLGMLQDGRIVGWQYGRMYCARFSWFSSNETTYLIFFFNISI